MIKENKNILLHLNLKFKKKFKNSKIFFLIKIFKI